MPRENRIQNKGGRRQEAGDKSQEIEDIGCRFAPTFLSFWLSRRRFPYSEFCFLTTVFFL